MAAVDLTREGALNPADGGVILRSFWHLPSWTGMMLEPRSADRCEFGGRVRDHLRVGL
jgi:hypothetical protein